MKRAERKLEQAKVPRLYSDRAVQEQQRRLCELELERTQAQMQIQVLEEARQALERAIDHYATLYDSAPIAFVTFDDKGLITELNRTAAELLRRERDCIKGLPFAFFAVAAEDLKIYLGHLGRCRAGRAKTVSQMRLRSKDKRIHVTLVSLPSVEGDRKVFRTAIIDLTERHEAEIALQRAQEFSESVVQTIREPLLVLDRDLHVVSVNRAFCKTFGTGPDEARGQSFSWLLDPRCDGGELLKRLHDVLSEDASIENFLVECQLRAVGKRFMLLNARRLSRENGKLPFVLVALEDVTERKQAEEALYRNQKNLEDFVENAPVGLHWASADGRIIWVNQGELDMLGYSREDYVGRMVSDFHEDKEAFNDFFQRLVNGSPVDKLETRMRCKDGSIRVVAIRANVLWEKGVFVHTRCFTLDITDQKQAEDALKHLNTELEQRVASRTAALKQSSDEMEAFCYTMAHDLRAPLRAMEGFAHAIVDDYGDRLTETGREYAKRIIEASQREDRLIQDLLEYSQLKLTPLTSGGIDLQKTVENALSGFHELIQAKKARVRLYPPFPHILGNASTLEHLLSHLISNALKFVDDGVHPRIRFSAEKRDQMIRLWIEDNGIGIHPEHHERIFRVFERLHSAERYPGTGIGLAMVRKGIERMGGSVGVESNPGKGSRFWVELPNSEYQA